METNKRLDQLKNKAAHTPLTPEEQSELDVLKAEDTEATEEDK